MADAGQSGSILEAILVCGILGAVGQIVRAVAGLKKMNDDASANNVKPADLFVASRLVFSLLIGFVAGILAGIAAGLEKFASIASASKELILGIMASGYAGVDFIESMAPSLTGKSGAEREKQAAGGAGQGPALRSAPGGQPVLLPVADYALKAAPTPSDKSRSGWVNAGIKNPGIKTIQQNVRACFNDYATPPQPAPAKYWTTQLNTMFKGSDPDWPDASSQLVADPRSPFQKDGLYVSPVYIYQMWQIAQSFTLNDFVECISACYDHPKPGH
jgi:hypothetical protein